MICRTAGGVEYVVPEAREENVASFTPTETYFYQFARLVVRLEELLEAEERNRDHALDLYRSSNAIIEAQKRRIDAAEHAIDLLNEDLHDRPPTPGQPTP
jgi:exonuclease VII small subunit